MPNKLYIFTKKRHKIEYIAITYSTSQKSGQ